MSVAGEPPVGIHERAGLLNLRVEGIQQLLGVIPKALRLVAQRPQLIQMSGIGRWHGVILAKRANSCQHHWLSQRAI